MLSAAGVDAGVEGAGSRTSERARCQPSAGRPCCRAVAKALARCVSLIRRGSAAPPVKTCTPARRSGRDARRCLPAIDARPRRSWVEDGR